MDSKETCREIVSQITLEKKRAEQLGREWGNKTYSSLKKETVFKRLRKTAKSDRTTRLSLGGFS